MNHPERNHDSSVVYEDTHYEMIVRRTIRQNGMAPIRVAPGEPGLNWVTGFIQSQVGCTPDEAVQIVGVVGAAWLDAHGREIEQTRVVESEEGDDQ